MLLRTVLYAVISQCGAVMMTKNFATIQKSARGCETKQLLIPIRILTFVNIFTKIKIIRK